MITSETKDPAKQRRLLHLICCLLPKVHRDTLEVLSTLLNWVSSFAGMDEDIGNKMDLNNLATVITPNLIYSNRPDVVDSFVAVQGVHTLLRYNEQMCTVSLEDVLGPFLPLPSFLLWDVSDRKPGTCRHCLTPPRSEYFRKGCRYYYQRNPQTLG
jgi:hypothetical protein